MERANPTGEIVVVTDNLSSHTSYSTRTWLQTHPRIRQVFIPKGACWLNLAEGWWRLVRRQALAGQCFADAGEITLATRIATANSTSAPDPGCGAALRPRLDADDGRCLPPLRNAALGGEYPERSDFGHHQIGRPAGGPYRAGSLFHLRASHCAV